MSDFSKYVLYEWNTGPPFLVRSLFPGATIIDGAPGDEPASILEQIPETALYFLPHLNCTRTDQFPLGRDELFRALSVRGLRIFNAYVTDISKSLIQKSLAELNLNTSTANPDGDPEELVIVKTDLNFAGKSEWSLTDQERTKLEVGGASDIIWDPYHYRVLPKKEVQPEWWGDARLVIERYVENPQGQWYRGYIFRNRLVLCELASSLQIKKVGESTLGRIWNVSAPSTGDVKELADPNLRQMVRDIFKFSTAFRLDYGTIDLVRDDAWRAHIIDVNSTPAYNNPIPGLVEFLRPGKVGQISSNQPATGANHQ